MRKISFGIIIILSLASCKKDWICTTTKTWSAPLNKTETFETSFVGTSREKKDYEFERSFTKVDYYSLTDSTIYEVKTTCL